MTRLLILALALAAGASAQTVEGVVTSGGQPVPLATVRIVDTALGTAADLDGRYRLRLAEAGEVTLRVTAVGYVPAERTVPVGPDATVTVDVALAAATFDAGAVVVTGTLERMAVRDSPVKVDVVPSAFLEMTPSANVMDALERVNGLYQQIDCGVCYTNNIRINGIDGPNTAVLIDGMPVMSSLATVYGLNGISPILIRQVEVVKGPMSTLYGSEALGGVINILTKDPATAPTLSTQVFSTTHAEIAAEAAVVPLRGRTSALVSGTLFHVGDYHDNNADGFSDRPFETRLALFGKATRRDARGFERASLVGKVYSEDRAAGTERFLGDVTGHRGSGSVYGESIVTRRAEVIGALTLRPDLTLRGSGALHDQDSFYGDIAYAATQADGFGQLVWTPATEGTGLDGHGVLVGAALRAVRYDDGSAATGLYDEAGALLENRPDTRVVPGLFVQDDWRVSPTLRLLGGFRADYQPGHGLIPSPRVAAKWQPSDRSTGRLSVGTGFRIVNLFTEDHSAYTGGRATLILEDLEPERSVSVAASVQHIFGERSPVTVDLDAFWTRFSNKLEPDYSVPGEIRYANLDGSATTRGLAAQVQGVVGGLRYTVAGTLLDVFVTEGGTARPLEFAPDYQGTATLAWRAPGGVAVDYTARLTGPMALPAYGPEVAAAYEAATGAPLHAVSPLYTVHNVQLTRDLRAGGRLAQLYVAVENVFDYRQSSPLVGYYDGTPGFGATFDTAYVFGPIEGRHFGAGVRVTLP
ncbi:TonB-dependent receptor [Rubrivirga sp. IMCC43871]|uniref:TonB-dependent receptor n=1 Tax=Rubrivirga sp. IMCC43871 TaxID=3391575 RepID=UPI00399009A6